MNEDEDGVDNGGGGGNDGNTEKAGTSQPATPQTDKQNITASEDLGAGNKKTSFDPAAASPEQLEEFYIKGRPASAEEYDLAELGEEEAAFFKQQFFDNKLTKSQGESLVKAYKQSIDKAQAPLFSADGFKSEMTGRFGENYQTNLDKINEFVKAEAAPEDAQLIEKLPNSVIGIVYGLIDKVMSRYAVNDTDTAKNGSGTTGGTEPDYPGFVNAMQTLRGRPHNSGEVSALKKQYHII